MTDIPEDVMRAARSAVDAYARGFISTSVDMVAVAILAERRRCAEVARHLNGWGADCGKGGHAEHIAKMIEAGT